MPAGRSESDVRLRAPSHGRRCAALLVLLALAGCPSRDPTVQPFRLTAVDATGHSVVDGFSAPGLVTVTGIAARTAATTLVVTPTDGTPAVTVQFDATAAPSVGFPDTIASGRVTVEIRQDPAARGPAGEPLPIRGLRIADSGGRYRFFIGEGDLRSPEGLPLVPRPLGSEAGEDLPTLTVVAPTTRFEPSKCGDVYWDRLQVANVQRSIVLDQHESATVTVLGGEDLPWSLLHVESWHRGGPDVGTAECRNALRAWFQGTGER